MRGRHLTRGKACNLGHEVDLGVEYLAAFGAHTADNGAQATLTARF
jgi:hypothetical protein